MALLSIKLSDLQRHSHIASIFKCDFCTYVQQLKISTGTERRAVPLMAVQHLCTASEASSLGDSYVLCTLRRCRRQKV